VVQSLVRNCGLNADAVPQMLDECLEIGHSSLVQFVRHLHVTSVIDVIILGPPAAPITISTSQLFPRMTVGHIEDSGLFPGLM
jgi:hypothetical protein